MHYLKKTPIPNQDNHADLNLFILRHNLRIQDYWWQQLLRKKYQVKLLQYASFKHQLKIIKHKRKKKLKLLASLQRSEDQHNAATKQLLDNLRHQDHANKLLRTRLYLY